MSLTTKLDVWACSTGPLGWFRFQRHNWRSVEPEMRYLGHWTALSVDKAIPNLLQGKWHFMLRIGNKQLASTVKNRLWVHKSQRQTDPSSKAAATTRWPLPLYQSILRHWLLLSCRFRISDGRATKARCWLLNNDRSMANILTLQSLQPADKRPRRWSSSPLAFNEGHHLSALMPVTFSISKLRLKISRFDVRQKILFKGQNNLP